MKDLLSKEHYCYKMHALALKRSAYSPSIDNTPIMEYPPILQENLDPPPPSMIFQKFQPPIIKGEGVHTMKAIFCQ